MAKNATMKRIFFTIFAFVIVLSSFYTLDFRAARSETQINSAVSTYSTGDPKNDFPGKIYLYVEGNDSVSRYLMENLGTELENIGMDVSVALNNSKQEI